MKRFSTKFNQPVKIEDINGLPMCITSQGLECQERCRLSFAGATLSEILGSSDPRLLDRMMVERGFFDWTIEFKEAPSELSATAKGASRICDICVKPVYYGDAYLLRDDTILASDIIHRLCDTWMG